MEAEISVSFNLKSKNQAKLFSDYLTEETRPILPDDVADLEHRELFIIIDDLASVEFIRADSTGKVELAWFIGGGDHISEIEFNFQTLGEAGASDLYGAIWLDGQLESIVGLSKLGQLKFLDFLNPDDVESFMDESSDIFEYLGKYKDNN